jgi:RNA polymerase sigma-70 factor (ECF subfamily)
MPVQDDEANPRAELQALQLAGTNHQVARLTLDSLTKPSGERALVERAREGDREAFGALVRAHLPAAIRAAMRVVRNSQDAEDVVQDAFLSALQNLDRFDSARPFWPWLSRIVVNRALDLVESRRVREAQPLHPEIVDRQPLPDSIAQESELVERVRLVAAAMPARQRLVVELFDIEGASVAEIAEMTGSSPSTVRWHLHMAHRKLRTALRQSYGGNP